MDYQIWDPDTGEQVELTVDTLRALMEFDDVELPDDMDEFTSDLLASLQRAASGEIEAVCCTEATEDDVLIYHDIGGSCQCILPGCESGEDPDCDCPHPSICGVDL